MSAYTSSYAIRYSIPSLQEQIEVAMITASQDIQNEATTEPDHSQRLAWANWASKNSSVAWLAFAWPVAMNPAIQGAVEADPSGQSVKDSDVQFVVNSALPVRFPKVMAKDPTMATWGTDGTANSVLIGGTPYGISGYLNIGTTGFGGWNLGPSAPAGNYSQAQFTADTGW